MYVSTRAVYFERHHFLDMKPYKQYIAFSAYLLKNDD